MCFLCAVNPALVFPETILACGRQYSSVDNDKFKQKKKEEVIYYHFNPLGSINIYSTFHENWFLNHSFHHKETSSGDHEYLLVVIKLADITANKAKIKMNTTECVRVVSLHLFFITQDYYWMSLQLLKPVQKRK